MRRELVTCDGDGGEEREVRVGGEGSEGWEEREVRGGRRGK